MDDYRDLERMNNQKRIRIKTSIPGLQDRIQIDLTDDSTAVYWYIKFNIPLDEATVSGKTMDVTDTDGYIMRTEISYNDKNHMIMISPLDTYEEGMYYLLNISKKVRSAKGNNLKSEIHILFKLINNKISEYKVLKSNVQVPKPRPRPKNYEQKYVKTKLYSFDETKFKDLPRDKLPPDTLHVNFVIGLIGLLLLIAAYFANNFLFIILSMAVCAAGVGHIVFQLTRPHNLCVLLYNRGRRKFNKEKYEQAEALFKRALQRDSSNEMAEFALNKVSFYL